MGPEVYERIGESIKYLVKSKGLKYDEFAKEIGVSKAAVSHWVNGRNGKWFISLSELEKVADYFFLAIDDLINQNIGKEALEEASKEQREAHPATIPDDVSEERLKEILKQSIKLKKAFETLLKKEEDEGTLYPIDKTRLEAIGCFLGRADIFKKDLPFFVEDDRSFCAYLRHLRNTYGGKELEYREGICVHFIEFEKCAFLANSKDEKMIDEFVGILSSYERDVLLTRVFQENGDSYKFISNSLLVKALLEKGAAPIWTKEAAEATLTIDKETLSFVEGEIHIERGKSLDAPSVYKLSEHALSYEEYARIRMDEKTDWYLKLISNEIL